MQLHGVDLYYLTKELEICIDSKIDQIYQTSETELIFRLYKASFEKKHLRISTPNFIYLADTIPQTPQQPSNVCTRLRKLLNGARIDTIKQINSERILRINLTKKDTTYTIIIELFGKGNIIFLDHESTIILALTYKQWADRAIKVKQTYQLPPSQPQISTKTVETLQQELNEIIQNDPKQTISKMLASSFGLGKQYAVEVCTKAHVDPMNNVGNISNLQSVAQELIALFSHPIQANITQKDIPVPILLASMEPKQTFTTFSEAIEHMQKHAIANQVLQKQKNKKLEKAQEILKQQLAQKQNFEQYIQQHNDIGTYIYEYFTPIEQLLEQFDEKKTETNISFYGFTITHIDKKNKKITITKNN